MRLCAAITLLLLCVVPVGARASSVPLSSIHLSHSVLKVGQAQTVSIQARDLNGAPLARAAVSLTVHYGSLVQRYSPPATNSQGKSSIGFRVPAIRVHVAIVDAVVSNGFLTIPLTVRFGVGAPLPPPEKTGKTKTLDVLTRVLPPSVRAPQPAWVLVYSRTPGGVDANGAQIDVAVLFAEKTLHLTARADSHGVATLRVDTSAVKSGQTARIGVVVRWKNGYGSSAASFSVAAPSAAPTSTPTPSPTASPTASRTVSPTATATESAGVTVTDTPVAPTATATPTAPGPPASTPTDTPVLSPTPTATTGETDTPTPQETDTPTPQPTAAPACPGSSLGCMQAMANLINATRAKYSSQNYPIGPLAINYIQSAGQRQCVGSIGHSDAMAQSGQIWHDNSNYPAASFPNNICVQTYFEGENVGMSNSGNELTDLQTLHNEMMGESWQPGCEGDHACNILNNKFTSVGIGIYVDGAGRTWLTEDFIQ